MEKNKKVYLTNSKYTIYEFQDDTKYYLSIPKEKQEDYQIFVSFPNKDIDSLKPEDKEQEIRSINDMLIKTEPNAIYLLCCLSKNEIEEFASYNDSSSSFYKRLQHKVLKTLSKTFDNLKNITYIFPVCLIKQNEFDSKLIDLLEINAGSYLKSIKLTDIKQNYYDLIFNETMAFQPIDPTSGGPTISKDNVKVKKLIPPSKKGFTTIYNISLTILLSLIIGIGIAYLLIK